MLVHYSKGGDSADAVETGEEGSRLKAKVKDKAVIEVKDKDEAALIITRF